MKMPKWFGGGKTTTAERAQEINVGDMSVVEERAAEDGIGTGFPDTWKVVFSESDGTTKATVVSFDGDRMNVTRELALTLSAVYSCIDRISSAIATMPFQIVKITDDEEQEVKNHPAKYILEKSPNDWQTPFTLLRQFMVDALNGNGYIWIKRNARFTQYYEMEYCDQNATELVNLGNGRWVYQYTDEDGKFHTIQTYDMIHVRALGNKGRRGLSPVKLHASTINMGLQMQEYGGSFFGAGAKPSGIVSQKGNLEEKAWNRAIENWNRAANQAKESKNRVVFLPNEVSYTPISISPVDAQLIQAMKLTKDDVCGIYNVPAWMVGNIENTSYANITAMATAFVKNTLLPWITNLEQEFTKKLLIDDEIENGVRVKVDFTSLLRGTPTEMLKYFGEASKYGFVTRNEGRVGIGYRKDESDPTMNQFTVNVSQSKLTEAANDETTPKEEAVKDENGNTEKD